MEKQKEAKGKSPKCNDKTSYSIVSLTFVKLSSMHIPYFSHCTVAYGNNSKEYILDEFNTERLLVEIFPKLSPFYVNAYGKKALRDLALDGIIGINYIHETISESEQKAKCTKSGKCYLGRKEGEEVRNKIVQRFNSRQRDEIYCAMYDIYYKDN